MSEPRGIDWSDPDAVAACLDEYHNRLLTFISNRMSPQLRQRVDADDILQEVGLCALRRTDHETVRDTPDYEPFGWLCHIAEQRIIDAHRRHVVAGKRDIRREVSIEATRHGSGGHAVGHVASLLAASLTSASELFVRKGQEARLGHVLATLPDRQRDVLRMRYVEGLSTREIAERTGMSDGAVRVLLSRLMKQLQTLLTLRSDEESGDTTDQ